MAKFEGQERRMPKIEACLAANGLESLDACRDMLLEKGIDVEAIVKGVQPICFENAVWAYTLGTAIAVKRGLKNAADARYEVDDIVGGVSTRHGVSVVTTVAAKVATVSGDEITYETKTAMEV